MPEPGSQSERAFVAPELTKLAFEQLWDSIRTCMLNVLFHRKKARIRANLQTLIEIVSTSSATIAGIGIVSLPSVRDSTWAVLAFCSALIGQLPSVFKLQDKRLEHKRLDNEYSSVLGDLLRIVHRVQAVGDLTPELHSQLQLSLEKFNFVIQKDDTDYRPGELEPLETQVSRMYPPSKDWKPQSALQLEQDV